jgi:predicted nicotinamide N-methyase
MDAHSLANWLNFHLVGHVAGTGCHVWTSALMLSEWLCQNTNTVRDKTVLEIGSGLVIMMQLDLLNP